MPNASPNNGPMAALPFSFHSLGRGMRRYSLLTTAFVLAGLAAGAAVWFLLPLPKHTGSVTFQVQQQPTMVLNPYDSRTDFITYRSLQAASVRSRLVLTAALADPTTAAVPTLDREKIGEPLVWLAGNLKVDFPIGAEFMRVALEGDSAADLLTILKAVTAAYTKEVINKDKAQRIASLEQLASLQTKYSENMRANRAKIRGVMAAVGGSGDPVALQIRERFIEQQIGVAESELTRVISDIRGAKVRATVEGSTGAVPPPIRPLPAIVLDDLVKSSQLYIDLTKRKSETKGDYDRVVLSAQPNIETPRMRQLREELAKLDADLLELPTKLGPQITARFQESNARDDQQRIASYKERIALLQELQKALDKDLSDLLQRKQAMNNGQLELDSIRAEVLQTEHVADQISNRIEALKPELDAPTRVSLWEEPAVSAGIEGNRRLKYSGIVGGGIIVFGLILITWLETRSRRIQSPEDVVVGLGLRVVGTVPLVPRKFAGKVHTDAHYLLTESVDSTRTMLMSGSKDARRILVSSAVSGEGKTSLVTHLAVSLARTGMRVLLIDADMRRPAVHKVLGIGSRPGLAEILLSQSTVVAATQTCRIPGLHVIVAGTWQPAATAALNGQAWDDVMTAAGTGYDFVLVDSPPILPVADALAMARTMDGVVIAVMRDVSRFSAVDSARQRLHQVGATILGVVVNGIESRGYQYYDYRYTRPAEAPTPNSATVS